MLSTSTMRSTLDPTLDVVFKLLLIGPKSHDILVALLSAVLRPAKPIVNVKILNPEMPKEGEPDKGIFLDIGVELEGGTRLDIEMQAEKRPAFRSRALYYWARVFGSQLHRGQDYQALRPVISILFLDYQELACSRLHSVFKVLEEVFSPALEIHVIELPKRKRLDNQAEGEQDLVRWTRFLKASSDEEAQEVAKEDAMIAKANAILEELSADPAAQELARQRQLALDSYRIELAAAKEEGKAEGRKDGLEEGEAKGLRNAIVALCEVFGIELGEERMTTLQALGVTELSELMQQIKQLRAWPSM